MRVELLVVAGCVTAVGAYACVLCDRALRMKQQQMYMNTVLQLAHTYVASTRSRGSGSGSSDRPSVGRTRAVLRDEEDEEGVVMVQRGQRGKSRSSS